MSEQTAMQQEIAQLIVDTLNLEDIDAADIEPEQPLFGEGLGLDSIDALELALAISGKYGFQLKAEDENNKSIFASLQSLASHIEKNRA